MNKLLAVLLLSLVFLSACQDSETAKSTGRSNNNLQQLLNNYWEERLQLFPLEATSSGDNRYNDKLTITIAGSFRDSLKNFYTRYLNELTALDSSKLVEADQLSYGIFHYEMLMNLESLKYPSHLMPINQFWAFTLELPQLGSGTGNQPFKTTADYDNWLKRLSVFPAWVDTAIANMRTGMASGIVLPCALVVKMLPQVKNVVKPDTSSIFYSPVKDMPDSISGKDELKKRYLTAITSIVNPTYTKLYNFLEQEYLPKSRPTSGVGSIPGGEMYYNFCARLWTTTALSPDSIYKIGLSEVARIEAEMIKTKEATGFKGDLKSFFKSLEINKDLFPFKTPKEVIDSFWAIKKVEDPTLKTMFSKVPKTSFTIRQTEAFRAASASAEYNQGAADGSRPGIFYVPILDATKFNAMGMSTLFLHEAIPGHHYQIFLQQENSDLPKFRRFLWYGAYGEGWAHYCETLGKDLGLYNDPYQYMGHLGDAMHRAIRLVVDAGMHSKNMTREEAIKYMMAHEPITEHEATAEIERYMAIPGQALSYKIGQMSISAERAYYEKKLGTRFKISAFHDDVLKNGCVPLNILHANLERWAAGVK